MTKLPKKQQVYSLLKMKKEKNKKKLKNILYYTFYRKILRT